MVAAGTRNKPLRDAFDFMFSPFSFFEPIATSELPHRSNVVNKNLTRPKINSTILCQPISKRSRQEYPGSSISLQFFFRGARWGHPAASTLLFHSYANFRRPQIPTPRHACSRLQRLQSSGHPIPLAFV
jgi:hypothetical protein